MPYKNGGFKKKIRLVILVNEGCKTRDCGHPNERL
jgi:hypothetical protein